MKSVLFIFLLPAIALCAPFGDVADSSVSSVGNASENVEEAAGAAVEAAVDAVDDTHREPIASLSSAPVVTGIPRETIAGYVSNIGKTDLSPPKIVAVGPAVQKVDQNRGLLDGVVGGLAEGLGGIVRGASRAFSGVLGGGLLGGPGGGGLLGGGGGGLLGGGGGGLLGGGGGLLGGGGGGLFGGGPLQTQIALEQLQRERLLHSGLGYGLGGGLGLQGGIGR